MIEIRQVVPALKLLPYSLGYCGIWRTCFNPSNEENGI